MKKTILCMFCALICAALYSQSNNDVIWKEYKTITAMTRPDGSARMVIGTASAYKTGDKEATVIYKSDYGLSEERYVQDVVPPKYLSATDTVAKDTAKIAPKKGSGNKLPKPTVLTPPVVKKDTVMFMSKEQLVWNARCTNMYCLANHLGVRVEELFLYIRDSCEVRMYCGSALLGDCNKCNESFNFLEGYINGELILFVHGVPKYSLNTGKFLLPVGQKPKNVVDQKESGGFMGEYTVPILGILVIIMGLVIAALIRRNTKSSTPAH